MKYPQLWNSSSIAIVLLIATLGSPAARAATHTVKKGDTFTAIAHRYKISSSSLQKANPRVKPGVIAKGQVLNLPGTAKPDPIAPQPVARQKTIPKSIPANTPAKKRSRVETTADAPAVPARRAGSAITTYRVKAGETLTSLARRSGISVGELADMNGLERTELSEGQKLILPSSAPAAPPSRFAQDHDPDQTVDLTPPARRPKDPAPARRPAPPVSPPAQGTYYHVVKRGETFSSIARERGVSVAALTRANQTSSPTRLKVNQKLNVPGLQVASRQTGEVIEDNPPARVTSYQPQETTEDPAESEPAMSDESEDPTRVAYRVTQGDTLESIARKFNTAPRMLQHLNNLGPFDQPNPGSFVTVPWQDTLRRN